MPYFFKVDSKNKQGFKWVCVADGPPDPVTGRRKQIARRADKKSDAEKLVLEALENLQTHGIDQSKVKNMPFEKVAAEWLDTYSLGKVKKGTIRVREKEIKILNRYMAKTNVDKVTHRAYQKVLTDLSQQEYAKSTIEGVHVTANMIFKYAMKTKLRKDNPCIGAVVPEKLLTVEDIENRSIEEKYLEKGELTEFLSAAVNHGLQDDKEIFYLLAFSGMRSGELCALKWTDINFETNEIRITKTLYNPDNNMRKYELTTPKTKGSIRSFDVDEAVIALLKEHHKRHLDLKQTAIEHGLEYHDANFVFGHANGYPIIPKNIIIRMNRLLKRTSIAKEATPHIFRHTHISMLAEAEIDLKTIMKRVGHDDADTTLKIYTHVTEKMKRNASERIKIHFAKILNFDFSQV